jgi:hypothetical protein
VLPQYLLQYFGKKNGCPFVNSTFSSTVKKIGIICRLFYSKNKIAQGGHHAHCSKDSGSMMQNLSTANKAVDYQMGKLVAADRHLTSNSEHHPPKRRGASSFPTFPFPGRVVVSTRHGETRRQARAAPRVAVAAGAIHPDPWLPAAARRTNERRSSVVLRCDCKRQQAVRALMMPRST